MSREASGIPLAELLSIKCDIIDTKDLRSAFLPILERSSMPEGDKPEDDASGDAGGDGNDGSTDDGASGTGDGAGDDDVKNPKLKELSDEAAKHRVRAKELAAELDAANKRLKEVDDKDKSELEKAQRDAKEALERATKAEAKQLEQQIKLAFFESGAAALFRNPATALKLIDLKDIKLDDDGEVDTAEVKKRAEAKLKEEPYLGKDGSEDDKLPANGQASGKQTNGSTKKDTATTEVLNKKFPALRSRS